MHSEPFRSKARWDKCKKHPGHKHFIPIRSFTVDLLPKPYRFDAIYKLICSMSDLTVCLRVKNISSHRPSGYALSSFRGKNTTHTGTGFVFRVDHTNDDSTCCDCPECTNCTSARLKGECSSTAGSTTTSRIEVFIRTAAHVVFDDEEAKSTFVDVFYDDENDIQNSRLLRGYCISSTDAESDISVIKCITHDQAVSDRLSTSLENVEKLQSKASNPFEVSNKLIEANLQGRSTYAVKGHFHHKPKTSLPLTVTDISVALNPIAVPGKCVESHLHECLTDVITGSESGDLLHKCHHCRSGTNLKAVDDDVGELHIFRMIDVVRSVKSKDNMQADGSEEAEMDNLEVSVHFPDGEKSLHNIWLFDEPVKKSKEYLLIQGGINDVSPDLLVMVIRGSDKSAITMLDHLDMQFYIHDLTQAEYIEITWKNVIV